jgi:hypothetical protein
MATKRNRAWFFTTTGDTKLGTYWRRFVGGGISRPTQGTFEDLLESVPLFDESNSAASVDSASSLKEKQGLVIVQTDAKVKTNDNSLTGGVGTAVVRPSQISTVAAGSDVINNDVNNFSGSAIGVTVDAVSTRNHYLVNFSTAFKTWLVGVLNTINGKLVPTGGTTGQALTKVSNTNHDLTWTTITGSGERYTATSSTSSSVTVGTIGLAVGAGFAYAKGNRVRISRTSDATIYMEGIVISYDGSILLTSVDTIVGTGTFTDWTVVLAGNAGTNLFITKEFEITGWDMDTTSNVQIAHGLSDKNKVRSISVLLRDDSGVLIDSLERGGYAQVDDTYITLWRTVAGMFDNTSYNDAGINRGYVTMVYKL